MSDESPDLGGWDIFADIADISDWLNRAHSSFNDEHTDAMRIMKITEEIGEAREALDLIDYANSRLVRAYIGYTSENPRKGHTHSKADLLEELADVVLTALVALHRFTGDEEQSRAVVATKVALVMTRFGIEK